MLIKAAINGSRTRAEHPAIPVTPEQEAREASLAIAAGAGAIHVHVRNAAERESFAPEDVARTLEAIRASCPSIPVGISTGAWIVPDVSQRLSLVRAWDVLPDFASVNVHEDGSLKLIRLLLDRGIGVEAGVWNVRSAEALLSGGLANECLRILIEPAEDMGDAIANLEQIEPTLGRIGRPRLLHGVGASAWQLIEIAARRNYDTRIGFEDTLTLPDGSQAENNGALVAAAMRIVAQVAPGREPGMQVNPLFESSFPPE
ncbi:MAG TPA: 3-keto-5-aminohexanoate cleavage protein [Casimicrobiaceae bacterium]|nr:3-keto-5-aminohexanoate cleavage protein [Casimicrobiaceae bacterium]